MYSLGEEAFYWYINLPVDSIGTWQQMKDTFLAKFRLPVSPTEVYRQLIEVSRQEREPIGAFNNRFQRAYSQLRSPYNVNDEAARNIYYVALDCFTSMFVQQANPNDLKVAYDEDFKIRIRSPATIAGTMPYYPQAGETNYLPVVNPILTPANQLVPHPGAPISQVPPSQPVYLQNTATSSRTQEEKDEMKELIEQVKRLSTEVTYLRNQNNQMQSMQRNYQAHQGANRGYQNNPPNHH